jgi:hypothetical protein
MHGWSFQAGGAHHGLDHVVDVDEIARLQAVSVHHQRVAAQSHAHQMRYDSGIGVVKILAFPGDIEKTEGNTGSRGLNPLGNAQLGKPVGAQRMRRPAAACRDGVPIFGCRTRKDKGVDP